MAKITGHKNMRNFVLCAILSALIVVMTVVPYTGYIYYGLIEITTLHIVVILGSIMLGWKYGAFLGLVWGVTCLIRAFTNPLWIAFTNPVVSVLPRIVVGIVPSLVYNGFKKIGFKDSISCIFAVISGTLTNTVLVLSALYIFSASWQGTLIYTIYTTLIGVNGLIELAAALIIVPTLNRILKPRTTVLGLDLGGSTTKLALVSNRKCIRTKRIDSRKDLEKAIEEICSFNVSKIYVTGVGASDIPNPYHNIPVEYVDEFSSLSRGAAVCSGKHDFLVTNIGTGTSFVRVTPFRSWHVGGTGLGGGSIQGLAKKLCGTEDMEEFKNMAAKGNRSHVDLQLQDICTTPISNLQPTSTVACMSKNGKDIQKEDLAAAICNMVFENIGVMSAFAVKRDPTRTIVLTGTVTEWPIAMNSMDDVSHLHNVKFIVPNHSAFCTAIGATLND